MMLEISHRTLMKGCKRLSKKRSTFHLYFIGFILEVNRRELKIYIFIMKAMRISKHNNMELFNCTLKSKTRFTGIKIREIG